MENRIKIVRERALPTLLLSPSEVQTLITCPVCRLDLEPTMRICPDCGTENAKFDTSLVPAASPETAEASSGKGGKAQTKAVDKAGSSSNLLFDRFLVLEPALPNRAGLAIDQRSQQRVRIRIIPIAIYKTHLEFQRAANWLGQASQRRLKKLQGPPLVGIFESGVLQEQALVVEEIIEGQSLLTWLRSSVESMTAKADKEVQPSATESEDKQEKSGSVTASAESMSATAGNPDVNSVYAQAHKHLTEMVRLTEWLQRSQTLIGCTDDDWQVSSAGELLFAGALEARCRSERMSEHEKDQALRGDLRALQERLKNAVAILQDLGGEKPYWLQQLESLLGSDQNRIMALLAALTQARPAAKPEAREEVVPVSAVAVGAVTVDDDEAATLVGAPRIRAQRQLEPLNVFPESLRLERRQQVLDRLREKEGRFREMHRDELELLQLDLGVLLGGGLGLLSLGLGPSLAPVFGFLTCALTLFSCGVSAKKADEFVPIFGVMAFIGAAIFASGSAGILPLGLILSFVVHWRISTTVEGLRVDKELEKRGDFGIVTRRRQNNEAALGNFRIFIFGALSLAYSVVPVVLTEFPMAKLTCAVFMSGLINFHLWRGLNPVPYVSEYDLDTPQAHNPELPEGIGTQMALGNLIFGLVFSLLNFGNPIIAIVSAALCVVVAFLYGRLVESVLAPAAIDMYNPWTIDTLVERSPDVATNSIQVSARPRPSQRFQSTNLQSEPPAEEPVQAAPKQRQSKRTKA